MPTNLETFTQESSKKTDFLGKIPVGSTKMRILSDFTKVFTVYEGEYPNSKYQGIYTVEPKPTPSRSSKLSGWAWAQVGEGIYIVQFPYALLKALTDLKNDPDWAFEEFPMPYDITIGNTGQGGARYILRGSPKRTPIEEGILTSLSDKRPIAEIVAAIINKQEGKSTSSLQGAAMTGKNYPADDIDPSDIPF